MQVDQVFWAQTVNDVYSASMAIHIALLITLIETLALSAVLMTWAKQVQGARLLVIFLLGVAAWIMGNELPNWVGIEAAPAAMWLLSSLPLTSAAFVHFCVIFCEVRLRLAGYLRPMRSRSWPRVSPWFAGPESSGISPRSAVSSGLWCRIPLAGSAASPGFFWRPAACWCWPEAGGWPRHR